MESFDLYDAFGNPLNKTIKRGSGNQPGEYHLVTHIWIRNQAFEYLIQQRNKTDDPTPFQWATHSGAVIAGETSLAASIREIKEELGITLKPEDFKKIARLVSPHPYQNYMTDLYLVERDIPLDEIVIDTKEVKDVMYVRFDTINQMIVESRFWNYAKAMNQPTYFTILEKS